MEYLKVTIDKVDNGYVAQFVEISALDGRPQQKNLIFDDFDKVIEYLSPKKKLELVQ